MAKIYVKNTDGTYIPQPSVLVSNLDIVQDKGDSLTSAMSQKAVTDELKGKQDTISDLDAIRQGAEKGSTALQSESDPIYTADKPNLALKSELDGKVDKEEGKGLSSNDYTDEEKTKLSELDIIINGVEETTSLPIEYTAEGRYMSATYGGAIVSASNMNVAFFPIQKGATLDIRVPKAGNAACYILGYTDRVDNHMNDGDVSEIADTIGTWSAFSRVITNAPNHKYLAVTYASGTTAPSVVQTTKQDPIVATKEELNILGNQLDSLEQSINALNIEKLEEVEDAYDKTIDKFVSPNLYDKSKGLLEGYINSNGGINVTSSKKYYYSRPIPVIGGHYYLLVGRNIPQESNIRCLDSSNNQMKVLIASTGQEYQSWYLPKEDGSSWTTNGQFKTPINAASIQFNVVWADGGNDNAIQLIDLGTEYHANPIVPPYQPFGERTYKIKESALPDTERMVDAPLLRNKRIFLFGASCTSNSTPGVKGFGQLIAEAAGIPYRGFVYDSADGNTKDVVMAAPNLTNDAKEGTCIRVISGRNDGVLPRIKRHVDADAEVDYVVLMFPANDAATQYRNVGQMTDSYTSEFDTDTQLGALEEVCRYVTEIGRPFKFGCIIAWDITWVASNFYDAYIPVLQKWGIPYLDLRRSAGFDIKNCAAHRRLYSLTGDDYSSWNATTIYNLDAKVKYGGVLYKSTQDNNVGHVPTDTNYWMYVGSETGDGTHLNSAGNEIVAGKILSFIESL